MSLFIKNNVNYDSKFDILNVYFGPTLNSSGNEEVANVIEFRDLTSNELTRLMIVQFKKMFEEKDNRLFKIQGIINVDEIYKKYIICENE